MTPPDAQGVVDAALTRWLRSWCEEGALPVLSEPLRATHVASHAGLDGAACELDGSHELARLGRWRGWLWRLQILWRESRRTRGARPRDPWDCGWWRAGSLAAAAAFLPRRPTLLMVRESDAHAAAELLAALQKRSPSYALPVRVLIVSGAPATK